MRSRLDDGSNLLNLLNQSVESGSYHLDNLATCTTIESLNPALLSERPQERTPTCESLRTESIELSHHLIKSNPFS